MATERINDVRAFQSFLDEKLSNGEVKLTLDEALELWDYENRSDEERRATRDAISRGLPTLIRVGSGLLRNSTGTFA